MDRSGNLFIIEDDYTSIKTQESSSSNNEDNNEENVNKESDERDRKRYPAVNTNERDRERHSAAITNERDRESYPAAITNKQNRERYPAAIQTSKRYEQLYDVGIKNIINNKTAVKSNRENTEYETNRRTTYKTDTAMNINDRTFESEEASKKRSGNLFIVEINNDVTNETNSTTTSDKQKSTKETNRATSEVEKRKEEKTRETCNISAKIAKNTDDQESCKSADVSGERNGKGFIIETTKPTNRKANSIDSTQTEKKHIEQDLETFTIPVINSNTNNHESYKDEVLKRERNEIDMKMKTDFSTDNTSHANVNNTHQVTQRKEKNGKHDGDVLITEINSSVDNNANSKTKDVMRDANGSNTEASVEDRLVVLQADQEQMQEKDVRKENLQLLTEIAELCNRPDRQRVENIFLLGKPGAGKSALVNTIIKALTGSYIPKASVGSGVRQSKTLTLDSYKSCGVTKEDIKDPQHRKLVEDILPKLPTILDAAGTNDPKSYANPEGVEEILELLIGGFIPPGTSVEFMENKQKDHYVGCLRDVVFTESKPEWKATKIVFVQSCRDSLPVDLIQCLDRILRKTDPKTAQLKYTGEVFVVITKYDLVADKKQMNDSDPSSENISMQNFLTLENSVAEQFSIKGELDLNMIRWVSYGEKRSFDDPNIDNIALKFIKRMLAPGKKAIESTDVPVVMTPEKLKKLEAQKLPKEPSEVLNLDATHNFVKSVVCVILVALLLKIITSLLSAEP